MFKREDFPCPQVPNIQLDEQVDVTKYSLEMQMWWRDHQQVDKDRVENELRAEQQKENPMSKNKTNQTTESGSTDCYAASRYGAIHKLKTWTGYYQKVVDGVKTFEIRLNDRDYRVGDDLILEEYDPDKERYTGRKCRGKITYITDFGQVGGYVVMSIVLSV